MKRMICAALVMVLVTGCSRAATTERMLDLTTVTERLRNEIVYEDTLTEISSDLVPEIYGIDAADIKSEQVYCSAAVTAEEVAVMEAVDEEAAKRIEAKFKERVEEQMESYETYLPKEVEKLRKAVVTRVGTVVVLSVSNESEQAKTIIGQ